MAVEAVDFRFVSAHNVTDSNAILLLLLLFAFTFDFKSYHRHLYTMC